MAPSRKDNGKTQIDEGSSEHQEATQHASSLKSRRLTFDFRNTDFYANSVIVPGDKVVLTSRVKNTNIVRDVEVFVNSLGLPYKGQYFLHGFTPEWEGYSKMDYFFRICRVSQQAFLSKKSHAFLRVFLF
ncbi:hypothetical protein KIW84_013093 [Lathyrus oleraceus]|uniref:Uncharacterized protein n=1 Tax=Pisum sativum TaxID=3888 RepID=A0A9D5BJF0_PEA|nr:hypothetical protein KIW84_013093 [Pisum sativum]